MAAPETQNRIFCIISTSSWNFKITVFHEYLAGIIFSEFVILEISRVFNLAIPKNRAGYTLICNAANNFHGDLI